MSSDSHAVKTLAELVANGECVLFLGNDLPLGFPGTAPPCRDELAAVLARDLEHINFPTSGNLAKVARLYAGAHGRHGLNRRVVELLKDPAYQPTPWHHQVAALPFRAIITTAQDQLLEQALLAAGQPHTTVLTDVETPYIDESQVMIYKLHGCVSRPASLVLTRKDHCLLEKRLSAYLSVLRYLFVTRPLLFLNYRLDDTLFETLFHEVTANVEGHRRRAYAVWPGVAPDWRDIWREDDLVLFDQPVSDFLDALARQVGRHERALVTEAAAGPLTKPPYKFLDYYESDDRDIFYGRQIESVRLFRLVLSHRLTVLFGASGTGKTSLLKAGVMPLLWQQGYATAYVRALDDPLRAVRDEVLALLRARGRAVADPDAPTLHAFFRAILDPDDRLVVFLDQFEEFFLRLGNEVRRRFWAELAAFRDLPPLLAGEGDGGGEVRFVLSLREDFLAPLDEARERIPELLGDSYRLTNLSDDKASTAITEPAARAGLTVAPDLATVLLDDLREAGAIAPPQLQIVLDRLYRDCLANPDAVAAGQPPVLARPALTLADYQRLGGAEGILAGYVKEALARLPDEDTRQTAQALLKVMVTSQATKAALDWAALRDELVEVGALDAAEGLAADAARDVLARLVNLRLVREFERGGAALYELAHDHMAAEIHTWIDEAEMEAKLARELLRREVESWHSLGKLIEPAALQMIHERREELKRLNPDELELLFRSALAAGYEVPYWFDRVRAGSVNVDAVALEGLKSESFHARAAAVAALGQLEDRFVDDIIRMLADDYPQVRVAAIQSLERLRPDGAWREHLVYECYVPAGPFIMGEDRDSDERSAHKVHLFMGEDRDSDERPAHEVHLEAFYIGRYPVTNADYKRYMDDVEQPFAVPPGRADHPVVSVTWYDARSYAAWARMRLLTEAEWEKAARGGRQIPCPVPDPAPRAYFSDKKIVKSTGERQRPNPNEMVRNPRPGRRYPWGDEFDKWKCNTRESRIGSTTRVGKYSPAGDSPYGCADMAGNVWEWTSSLLRSYPYRADDGREDPMSGANRVQRGGCFGSDALDVRCASRNEFSPLIRLDSYGFRCGWGGAPHVSPW